MFKIESYITPIILNHVAKYVKNIRPQDAQVSLWEGAVAFQNLDLRLDVLEEELQLPFEFLSGHIHELSIHVPWTKIASEPITITINTIEFVLKLKDQNSEASHKERKKKISKIEDNQQGGYMPGLVNKIVNNISINCHNIILKYVEEDIVVSMNVQLLSFCSADEKWNPSFIDVNPIKISMRKRIQISDLTVCLDKRNAVGQIDVCQEPILYRCTLEMRILRKYNIATATKSSTTRIDLFTKGMDINVSSQQFPMAMRLLILMMALKNGDLKVKSEIDVSSEAQDDPEHLGNNDGSYLSWAWNLIPSIFPEDSIFEETESIDGHFLDIGVYIENLKITLKSLEMFTDSIVQSTRKIRYHPILRLTLNGIYSETLMAGHKWFNTKAGVSQATLEPLGNFAQNSSSSPVFLRTETTFDKAYLDNSLFDDNSIENSGRNKIFIVDWESHITKVTDSYLLYRTPALAFDMVHHLDIPDDMIQNSELGSDLEYSNLSEKLITRIFISSTTIKYNSALFNVIKTIEELMSSYDYPPYVEEKLEQTPSKLAPPSTDDYDALMSDIPRRIYEITLENFGCELFPQDENSFNYYGNNLPRKRLNNFHKKQLPYLTVQADQIILKNTTPIYMNRLVHTTCQLPTKPNELLDACYNDYKMSIKNASLSIVDEIGKTKLISIPNLNFSYGTILLPKLWNDENIIKLKIHTNIKAISFIFNRPQQLLVSKLLYTFHEFNLNVLHEILNSSSKKDIHTKHLPKIEINIFSINFSYSKFENITICDGYLKSIRSLCMNEENKYLIINALGNNMNIKNDKWCTWTFQLPNDSENILYPPIVSIKIDEFLLIANPILRQFFTYEENTIPELIEYDIPLQIESSICFDFETKSSKRSVPSERHSKKIVQPEETIHLSSDKGEKSDIPLKNDTQKKHIMVFFLEIVPIIKSLVMNIDVEQCLIAIPTRNVILETEKNLFYFQENCKSYDFTLIRLPKIKCKSSASYDITDIQMPIVFPSDLTVKDKLTFPWTCEFSELTGSTTRKGIDKIFLLPGKVNVTIALDHKKDTDQLDNLALNLHIDTSPITLDICEDQVNFLRDTLDFLYSVSNLVLTSRNQTNLNSNCPKIITTAEDESIKEFLAINSNSEISTEILRTNNDLSDYVILSIWLQWTVTKFTIQLINMKIPNQPKLTIEIEDFITSIDKQHEYFKVKSKIGTVCIEYFELNEKNESIINDSLKLNVRTETTESKTNDTFLDLTITVAETGSVFKKWGTQKKIRNLNHSLAEVMITAQAVDVRIDLKRIEHFVPIIFALFPQQTTSTNINNNNNSGCISVSDLPLLYFESEGFTVYIPNDIDKNLCNVLIFKIGQIKITPNVENPLSRNPIRPDVYTKAAQMRILNTPGSKIEDRQYEVVFNDISAVTSNWSEVLRYMKENSDNFYSTNPAFEWNRQNKRSSIEFNQIFNNFKISVIYAPCIVYKNILISGQSIEFNCIADLIADITTDQMLMFNCLYSEFENIQRKIISISNSKHSISHINKRTSNSSISNSLKSRKSVSNSTLDHKYESIKSNSIKNREEKFIKIENINTDSGIASTSKTQTITNQETLRKYSNPMLNSIEEKNIPYEISFIAGIFTFRLYHSIRNRKTNENNEESFEETFLPLITMTITQPSMLISQRIFEKTIKFSLFNINISFGRSSDDLTKSTNEFNDLFFETRQGNLNSAGIPPSLLFIKYKQNLSKHIEIDCNIGRPTRIFFSHKTLEKILTIRILLNELFITQYYRTKDILKPINRGTKIKLFRYAIYNADRLNISIEQTNIECKRSKQYDIKLSLGKLRTELNITDRPEKLNFNIFMESFLISTNGRIMLHPITMKLNGTLIQENWCKLPILLCNMKIDVIQIDIGSENIINLLRVNKNIMSSLDSFTKHWEHLEQFTNESNVSLNVKQESLTQIILPEIKQQKKDGERKQEYYQDDLRAGAFQFIETYSENMLPLPYQIQIIMKNNGIVCWRYPQPRTIYNMQIFPVPIQTSKQIYIKCRLEYYSESHGTFLQYCNFFLSETETKSIELIDKKITANTWRIVILQSLVLVDGQYFEESVSSEDENDDNVKIQKIKIDDLLRNTKTEKDFKLHPKALVACMRIDSMFDSNLIPKLQAMLDISLIQINLQTQHKNKPNEMPKILKNFKLSNDYVQTQTFSTLILSNLNIHGNILSFMNYMISTDFNISLKFLDYSYLNMLDFIEDTNLKAIININEIIDINLVIDKLHFNIGPAIIHTCLISEKLFWQSLYEYPKEIIIFTRFIICNTTTISLQFSQFGSNELILLKPNECSFYAFPNDKLEQKLIFAINDGQTLYSEPVAIDKEDIKYLKLGNSVLIIKIEKISSTQLCIFVRGQIEFVCMANESFRIQYKFCDNIIKNDNEKPRISDFIIEKYGNCTFFGNCVKGSELFLRLKLNNSNRRGWSGEVPLRKTNRNIPWLVKVPSTKQEYISFWVRTIHEDIKELQTTDFHPQRILVTIWPMFLVRSMLSSQIKAIETSSKIEYTFPGRGHIKELEIAGTHETDHQLIFDNNLIHLQEGEKNQAILSYKAVDWNKFFWINENLLKIENSLIELSKSMNLQWLGTKENEFRCRPISMPDTKTTPIYKCLPSRDLSCSLMLEISPWCLFINSTGIAIKIESITNNIIINTNNVAMLCPIEEYFNIHIQYDANWIKSLPIFIHENFQKKDIKNNSYLITETGSIIIDICDLRITSRLILSSSNENNTRCMILSSFFIVTNLSKHSFKVLPFVNGINEPINRSHICKIVNDVNLNVPSSFKNLSSQGISIDKFFDVNLKNSQRKRNISYNYFICLKLDENYELSIPLYLNKPFTRKSFSIQNNEESIPLASCNIEHKGQNFLFIYDDTCPGLEIDNQTDFNFHIGQAIISDSNKLIKVISECDIKDFEWYQILQRKSKLFYTPPEMYSTFPNINENSCFNLTLAAVNDSSENIVWSKPIQIDNSQETYLNVPLYGDIKIIVCDNHKAIKISIFYLTEQLSFCVKDLRTRLLNPINSDLNYNQENSDIKNNINNINEMNSDNNINIDYDHCSYHKLKKIIINFQLFIKEINTTIFIDSKLKNSQKNDILSIYIDEFFVKLNNHNNCGEFILSNLQIDNQLYSTGNYDFPVVLCPQLLYERNTIIPTPDLLNDKIEEYRKNPLAYFCIKFDDEFNLESIHCQLKPIRAYIEDTFLNDLFDHLVECDLNNVIHLSEESLELDYCPNGYVLIPKVVLHQALYLSEPLKLKSIRIEPISVLLSVHTCVRLYIALDHSPLDFSHYEHRNILTLPLRLGHQLGMHYLSGALFGAGWVVGSLEILGSPGGLARSVTTGLRDFVSMPVQGLLRGPWGFIIGITHGSASLLKNITAGTLNSVTKLAASVARNLDRLTMDDEHFQRTETLRRSRPQGLTEGFSQGLTGLGISLLGAVGGLARHPLEARSPVEVVTGVGKGIVGAFTKPISGAAELVALTGQGMLHTVGFNAMPQQRTPHNRNSIIYPADCRITWKLLPNVLSTDQILFCHEATLVMHEHLKRAIICLTPTVLVVFELDNNVLSEIVAVDRIEASFDEHDKTLINVKILSTDENDDSESNFINARILSFLRDSNDHLPSVATYSLDDLLENRMENMNTKYKLRWSFYISQHLGAHLLRYLSLVKKDTDKTSVTTE